LDSLPEASFDAAKNQPVATCLPNTRCEVLAQIRRWADGDGGRRIYWLKGMAGTGKSTIALTISREYSDKKRLGASFFFSRGGGDLASTRRFAATVAVQLAETSRELRRHIADAAASSCRIRGLGLYDQWEKLVLQPLAQLGSEAFPYPLIVVVDALDECDNNDEVSLLIRCLAAAVAVEHVDLRIFVTSRPDQPTSLGFDSIAADAHQDLILHNIEQSIVDQDLAVYYKYQLERIGRTSGLDAAVLSDEVVEKLVEKSCGLFIYAATACRFIREGGPLAGDRLAHLISDERLPAKAGTELDRMYTTALEYSLSDHFDAEETARVQELFGHVVGSIAVLFDALSPDSLAMMVAEPRWKITSMLGNLHSLVDVPEQEGRPIRLLHPSFREFLLDPQRCHLRRNMCDLRRPGTRIGDIPRSDVDESIPFAVQYACRYWVYHLQQSDVDPSEHPGILDFFRSRFLSWLETLAFTGRVADGIAMVKLLEDMLPVGSTNDTLPLNAFVYDARRFLLSHSSIIEEAPLQVYCCALVFSPEASIIRRLYIHQLPKWILRAPALSEDWGAHLKTLSHPSSVEAVAVAVSPNSRLIVSGSNDNTVRVWDAATGAARRVLEGHTSPVLAVAVSPNGQLIVSGSGDNTVRVWDAATGASRCVLRGHSSSVRGVAVLLDGRLIVSGSIDKTVRVWDIVTGAIRHMLEGHTDLVLAVAVSPNGQLIVSGSADNTVRIWDAATGTAQRVLKGHSYMVLAVAVSPNGQLIVSGSADNTVRVWDIATGGTRRVLKGHSSSVEAVAVLPDSRIVSGSSDDTVRVWDAATGTAQRVLKGHSSSVVAIAVSSDGQLIVSGSRDDTVRVWDATMGATRRILEDQSYLVLAVAVSPDGRLIVSGSDDKTVRVWDLATGATRHVFSGHTDLVSAVAVSPDSRLIISGSGDNTVRVWDIATGAIRRVLKGHRALVSSVAVLSDSRLIVSGSFDNTVRVWDIATGAIRRVLSGHTDLVSAIAVSPDGRLIVSGSFDNTARIWDTATGTTRCVLSGHTNWVLAVAVSPNSRLIVSGSFDNTVRVWDAATGATRHVLEGHCRSVSAVAVSPDDRLIVSSSNDRTVRIWAMATGAEQLALPVAIGLRHLSFSSCGKHLVTDCGILPLPPSDCRCSHHVFATRYWITDNGEDLLYLHPDYQKSFGFLSGNIVVYVSHSLQFSLPREALSESI
ncbi:WD40-repeat-containing domain protein, partial [Achaetomium macrosporum]